MEYHRHLPHIQPDEAAFFITIRLANSIPIEIIKALQEQHKQRVQVIKNTSGSSEQYYAESKRHFGTFDTLLDTSANGPYFLGEKAVAEVVMDSIQYLAKSDFSLIAYCIMSNHIHLVLHIDSQKHHKPLISTLRRFKRFTALEANKILQRIGTFWQAESYDHVIRDGAELKRIIHYTLNNPVKAGLVDTWEEWPYSFVNEEYL